MDRQPPVLNCQSFAARPATACTGLGIVPPPGMSCRPGGARISLGRRHGSSFHPLDPRTRITREEVKGDAIAGAPGRTSVGARLAADLHHDGFG